MKLLMTKGDAFDGGKANSYGQATLLPEEIEDLWHTYNLIAKGDKLLATTFRKVQKESSTGSVDSQKVKMSLAINVGRVDFDPDGGSLRVSGTIASEHEGLRLGSHHTLELELHRKYTLAKAAWDSLYLDRIAEATEGPVATADVAALLMQQGLANLCLVSGGMSITRARLECRAPTKGNAAVQAGAKKETEKWYEQILQAVLRHVDFSVVKCVVLAGPGFVKDQWWEWAQRACERRELRAFMAARPRWVLCHASSGYKHALKEVFNSEEAAARLADTRAAAEVTALRGFFDLLAASPDRVTYGLRPVAAAAERGAIQVLLLADSLLRAQHVTRRKAYVELVDAVKALGAKVHVFSSMHVSGEQLAGFSGVAAVLRFPCTIEELLGPNHNGYDDDDDDDDDGGSSSGGEDDEAGQGVPHGVVQLEEGY